MANATCNVCCEPFHGVKRKPAACPSCAFVACAPCVRTYLLGQSTDAACMNCRRPWEREILETCLTKAWVNGDFKRHRESVLFDRERALLPATQERAQAEKAARTLMVMNVEIQKRLDDAIKEIQEFKYTLLDNERQIGYMRANGRIPVFANVCGAMGRPTAVAPNAARFLRGCPRDGCRGFVGTNMTCGICEARCCKRCYEPVAADEEVDDEAGDEIGGDDAGPSTRAEPEKKTKTKETNSAKESNAKRHMCKPEDVETAKMLRRECRPCPKCAAPITKIDGCNQMWCPACQTAFCWVTGAIENGRVHNPHYYEWLRRQNGGQAPREAGDLPCGGIPSVRTVQDWAIGLVLVPTDAETAAAPLVPVDLMRMGHHRNAAPIAMTPHQLRFRRLYDREDASLLFKIHRAFIHIERVWAPTFRPMAPDNTDLRVRFLLGDFDETSMRFELQKKEKAFKKKQAVFGILEMLIGAAGDLFRNAVAEPCTEAGMEKLHDQLNVLRTFSNEALERARHTWDCKAPIIPDDWEV